MPPPQPYGFARRPPLPCRLGGVAPVSEQEHDPGAQDQLLGRFVSACQLFQFLALVRRQSHDGWLRSWHGFSSERGTSHAILHGQDRLQKGYSLEPSCTSEGERRQDGPEL